MADAAKGTPVGGIYFEVSLETKALIDAQRRVDRELKYTSKSFDQVTDAQDRQSRSADVLATRLTRIASAVASLAAATYLVAQSDAYTKLNAQLKLATKSEEDFVKARQSTISISKDAQADLLSIGTLYARISKSTQEMGASQQRVADITKVVALSLKVSGAGAAESSSAMLQLSQAFASGVLRGEEFNAVADAAPRLLQALADGMNVPVGQLRTMAAEGKLTSDILATALPKALKDLEQEAKSVQTISGAFQELRNEITLFVGEQMQASGASKMMASGVAALADNVSRLGDYMGTFLTAAQAGAVLFAANMAGRFTTSVAEATAALLANVEATRAAAAAEVMRAKAQQTAAYEAASQAAGARAVALATTEQAAANLAAARTEVALAAAEVERAGLSAALARGTQAQSAATLVSTLATNRLTAAKLAEAEANAVLVAAEEALAVTRGQATVAANAATASTAALTTAQRAQAAASAIAAAASRAFGAVMAALGGPVGIAIIGLAALALNWDKVTGSANEAARISEDAASRIQKALGRNAEAPMRQLMGARDDAASGLAQIDAQIERAEKLAKLRREGGARFSNAKFGNEAQPELDLSKLTKQREAYRAALLDAEKAIDDFKAKQTADLFPGQDGPLKAPPQKDKPAKKPKAAKFDSSGYLADLRKQTLDGVELVAAIEEEELRKNDARFKAKELNATEHAEAMSLIEAKAAKDRQEIQRAAGEEYRKYIEESAKEDAEARAKAIEYAAQLTKAINPIDALRQEYEAKLQLVTQYEQLMAKAGVDATAQGQMTRTEITRQYELQRQALAEQSFRSQSDANAFLMDSLNSLSQTATTSIMGLINGTMTAQEAMRGLASTVLNEAVGALVQIGVQQIKNALTAKTIEAADKARAAALGAVYTASVAAQVSGMSAMAAQNAFAATAAIPIVGPALAPAAAAAAGATAAALGAPAIATAPIAGARQYGGPVSAGSMYRVGEGNRPEMFVGDSGRSYMIPGEKGKVVSNGDLASGGGGQFNLVIEYRGTPQAVQSRSYDSATDTHRLVMADLISQVDGNSGPFYNSLTRSTNVRGRL